MKDYTKLSRKKYEKKLFRRFKSLYRHHKLPMSQTCMCWGVDTGPGWYNLIWKLSENIEKELKKENLYKIIYEVYSFDDDSFLNSKTICKTSSRLYAILVYFYNKLCKRKVRIFEQGFSVNQIKEKFGTLRYYVSGATDKIDDLISQAEDESEKTCEICGKNIGEKTTYLKGCWVYNKCKACRKKGKN